MNSSFRSVQILVDLLKQYKIKDVVLSPGGSDIPLIHSIETDEYFTCYSVVDERSAAYFAMGVAQQKNVPVACVCTSGTAVCNYLPGITEAFYQSVPVLAITADKNPYYQGQLEIQKIEQTHIFDGVVKKSVDLPVVQNSEDEWLCNRLVNEALLALTHHGRSPVQINVPIVGRTDLYDDKTLPAERKINIVEWLDDDETWNNYAQKLVSAKRVLFVMGQGVTFTSEIVSLLEELNKKCNCVYSVEHLSNLDCEGCIHTYPVSEINGGSSLEKLVPEIVVSIGDNLSAYNLRPFLRRHYKQICNWQISESIEIRDAYKCLTAVFDMKLEDFLRKILSFIPANSTNSAKYKAAWEEELSKITIPEFEFSNLHVAKKISEIIPENSVLHLAILNSTRIMQYYKLAKGIRTYSNVGALGIDGCVSTFAGQAASTDELAFLIVGDLSFFYDMNALWNSNFGCNLRILLLNNGGGEIFQALPGLSMSGKTHRFVTATHKTSAQGWATERGFLYQGVHDTAELEEAMKVFTDPNPINQPVLMEVFTDKDEDVRLLKEYYHSLKTL